MSRHTRESPKFLRFISLKFSLFQVECIRLRYDDSRDVRFFAYDAFSPFMLRPTTASATS